MRETTSSSDTVYFFIADHPRLRGGTLWQHLPHHRRERQPRGARQLYDAWGNVCSGGGMPTDIGYTGQRLETYIKSVPTV